MLYSIDAPHYNAAIFADKRGIVVKAAPILNWTLGQDIDKILDYFERKGYTYCAIKGT